MSLGMKPQPVHARKVTWTMREEACSDEMSSRNLESDWSKSSVFSVFAFLSVGSFFGVTSILSFVGAACVGSTMSFLSIASSLSILSVGSVASVLSVGATNCYMGYYEDCGNYKPREMSDVAIITVVNFIIPAVSVLLVKLIGHVLRKRKPKRTTGRPPHLRTRDVVRRIDNC